MGVKEWILIAMALAFGLSARGAGSRVVVRPGDTGEALVNPGMGWGLHYYSNIPTNYGSKLAPSDTLDDFPGLSHIYLRIPWSYLEPKEGKFDWSILDIPAQRWIDKINLRLGYRLQLVEASWPGEIDIDSHLLFTSKWRNAGVAPCLPGGHPAVTLKDSEGGIVGVFVDDRFDVSSLPPSDPQTRIVSNQDRAFALSPNLRGDWRPGIREPGEYSLYISIRTKTGTPKIALPLPENDGKERYRLGTLKVISAND